MTRISKNRNVCFSSTTSWVSLFFFFSLFSVHSEATLTELELALQRELALVAPTPKSWVVQEEGVIDVAIIGGGMAGMVTAVALRKEGITNFIIFDENSEGNEGPWTTQARMHTLRTGKNEMGIALGIPSLTFQAWYEAQHGEEAWKKLGAIPRLMWRDYLTWYRKVMQIPVKNGWKLQKLQPEQNRYVLQFEEATFLAKKVVLATGMNGFGGAEIPEYMKKLSKKFYAHTEEMIDFSSLAGKKVVVVGGGASAFDAAAAALESGAESVQMLVRHSSIRNVIKTFAFGTPGALDGYYLLPDRERIRFYGEVYACGVPPPRSAILRVKNYPNFHILYNCEIDSAQDGVTLETSCGTVTADFVILATGFRIDGALRPELKPLLEKIQLWGEKMTEEEKACWPALASYPYLDDHFAFIPFKDIYCLNYSSLLSHGFVLTGVGGMSLAATRLVKGIVADFFRTYFEHYYREMLEYDKPLFGF